MNNYYIFYKSFQNSLPSFVSHSITYSVKHWEFIHENVRNLPCQSVLLSVSVICVYKYWYYKTLFKVTRLLVYSGIIFYKIKSICTYWQQSSSQLNLNSFMGNADGYVWTSAIRRVKNSAMRMNLIVWKDKLDMVNHTTLTIYIFRFNLITGIWTGQSALLESSLFI